MGTKAVSGASGKTGRVKIGATVLCVTEWSATEMADEENTTNSCSDGYDEQEYGNKHVEGTINADWDTTADVIESAPTLRAGARLTDARLFLHDDGNYGSKRCHFPLLDVTEIAFTVPAKGKVSYNFSFKSYGPYAFMSDADYTP